MGVSLWAGYQLRSLLEPVTLRAKPFSFPVRPLLLIGAGLIGYQVVRRIQER